MAKLVDPADGKNKPQMDWLKPHLHGVES
jgi:hypothetical protein